MNQARPNKFNAKAVAALQRQTLDYARIMAFMTMGLLLSLLLLDAGRLIGP